MTKLFLFYRDLRLEDNTCLKLFKSGGRNVKYGCIDDPVIRRNKYAKQFYEGVLDELGVKISIRFSDPKQLMKYIQANGVTSVGFNKNLLIWEDWQKPLYDLVDSVLVVEDYTLLSESDCMNISGQPYKVYTPFYRHVKPKLPKPVALKIPKLGNSLYRREAFEILKRIRDGKYKDYEKTRNYKGGTTRLGKYISYGVISIRDVYNAIGDRDHELVRELLWRDFFYCCHDYLKLRIESASERSDAGNKVDWHGATSYIRDGVEELVNTGWVGNRQRMNMAMYLIRRKGVSPLKVCEWFSRYMVDYYESSNDGGIFWVINQPEFREFNYELQERKYDRAAE